MREKCWKDKNLKFLRTLLILLLIQFKAHALIEVDITRGNLSPLPVAVSPLSSDKKSLVEVEKILKIKDIGSEISLVVENNLKQTGLFNPLAKDAFLQKPDIAHFKPRFEDWKLIKAQALITGKVEIINENLLVRIKLKLKPDGSVIKSEILDHARMNKPGQSFYKVLAESALRAVRLCQPLRVPTTGYERWKDLQLNFDAREMLEG